MSDSTTPPIRIEVFGPTDDELEKPDTISLPPHSRSGRTVKPVQRYVPVEEVDDDES